MGWTEIVFIVVAVFGWFYVRMQSSPRVQDNAAPDERRDFRLLMRATRVKLLCVALIAGFMLVSGGVASGGFAPGSAYAEDGAGSD